MADYTGEDSSLGDTFKNSGEEFYFSSLDYEKLGEAFEKDSRRYSKYLGDDFSKEKLI